MSGGKYSEADRAKLAPFALRVSCAQCWAEPGSPCVFQKRSRENNTYHVARYDAASVVRNAEIGTGRKGRPRAASLDAPLSARAVSNYELRKAGCYRVATEEEAKEEQQA